MNFNELKNATRKDLERTIEQLNELVKDLHYRITIIERAIERLTTNQKDDY